MTTEDEIYAQKRLEYYDERLPKYQALVDELYREIPPRLSAANLKLFRVEARVKGKDSYARKSRLKSSVEDLVGVRVLVYFRSDIPIAEKVLRDMFVFHPESWSDKSELLEDSAFGYRSIQFIGHTKSGGWDAEPTILEASATNAGVSVEVQVRTALEHVWGEIEHDRYKPGLHGPTFSRELNRRFAVTAALIEQADENLDHIRNEMALGPVTVPSRAEDIVGWDHKRFVQADRNSRALDKQIANALDIHFGTPYKEVRGYSRTCAAAGWGRYSELVRGILDFGELGRKLAIAVANTEHDLVVGDWEPDQRCVAFKGLGLFWAAMAAVVGSTNFVASDYDLLTIPQGRLGEYQIVMRYLLDNPEISALAVRDRYRAVAAPVPRLGEMHLFPPITLD